MNDDTVARPGSQSSDIPDTITIPLTERSKELIQRRIADEPYETLAHVGKEIIDEWTRYHNQIELFDAVKHRDVEWMKRAIETGADVNKPYLGQMALAVAVYSGPEEIEVLLAAGADPTLKNDGGDTALDWARISDDGDRRDEVRFLLERREKEVERFGIDDKVNWLKRTHDDYVRRLEAERGARTRLDASIRRS
jgi:hypothetical protein